MRAGLPGLALWLAVAALAGCAGPGFGPPGTSHIEIATTDSEQLVLEPPWFMARDGAVVLAGRVRGRGGISAAADTHVDVVLMDAAGKVLHASAVEIDSAPGRGGPLHRHGGWSHRLHPHGGYELALDLPLERIARIEVRAHGGEHARQP